METSCLRSFCALVETGNLREAAKIAHLSPGALSKAVRRLETELNAELFIRSKQRLFLSKEGRTAYQFARRILQESELLQNALIESKQESGVRRIGSYSTFTTYLLGPFFTDVLGEDQLAIHPLLPGQIEKALLDRVADIGLTSFPVSHESLRFDRVGEFEMCIYTRRGAFSGVASEDMPFAVPFVRFSEASIGGEILDAWPVTHTRKIKFHINGLESLLETCRNGVAAAVFPKFVVELHNQKVKAQFHLEARALPPKMGKIVLKLFMVTRAEDPRGAFYDNFRKMLRGVCSIK